MKSPSVCRAASFCRFLRNKHPPKRKRRVAPPLQRFIALVFAAGVFHVTLSTPGCSCLDFQSPLTANARPLNEWVSTIARLSPCYGGQPVTPSPYASAALYVPLDLGPVDAVPRRARRCTCLCCSTHLLSFRKDGSKNSLVMRDHEEVCPLSRRVISQPVSRPLQPGIRFLLVPVPAPPWADLQPAVPEYRERYGVPRPLAEVRRVRCLLLIGDVWVTNAHGQSAVPVSVTVLVQAY